MLIALAFIAILAGIGAMQVRGRSAISYANDLKSLVQQARFEAIKRNVPVAVVWNEGATEFQTVLGPDSTPCEDVDLLYAAGTTEYRDLEIEPGFENADGVVWLPNGQARSCSLGPFSEHIAVISDRTHTRTITVSLTGRVTIE